MVSFKELAQMPEYIHKGHAACAGCGAASSLRMALKALGPDTIQVTPACCTSIIHGPYPTSAFKIPLLNIAFAAAPSTASGIVQALRRKGKKTNVLCWAGDGGTTDIGIASLSGAAERNEDLIYICYDNNIYGNTGNQRSSATPPGAKTSTTPTGTRGFGKFVPFIMLAHQIQYVATTTSAHPRDIYEKVKKMKEIEGFKYLQIYASCPANWRIGDDQAYVAAKAAVTSGLWPVFEAINGKVTLTNIAKKYRDPANRTSLQDFVKASGARFKGITEEQLDELKVHIERRWAYLEQFLE